MKILLVEDDLRSAETLLQLLAKSHYVIDSATNVKTAWQCIETYDYDLVILDVMIPDGNAISLCTNIRNFNYTMPVLLLTAQDSTSDRIVGLEAGADDYVVKPYDFKELLARIRALLRRDRQALIRELTWGELHIDLSLNTVTYNHQTLNLTQKEYGLLELFLRHPQQVFSRNILLDRVWSAVEFPSEEAVTTQIKGLRHKLKAAGLTPDPIETIYGMGYRLRQLASSNLTLTANTTMADNSQREAQDRVHSAIINIVHKLQTSMPELIALFDQTVIALEKGNLSSDLRYQAYLEAHRLIGSLGSLGFPEESAIACQIEEMLNKDFPLVSSNAKLLGQLITKLEQIVLNPPQTSETPLLSFDHSPLPLLLIVDDNVLLTRSIQIEAETWGMRVQTAFDLTTAREKIVKEAPDVILLDMMFANSAENGLILLDELAQRETKIPTVMMTATSGLSTRVKAARKGGCSFIEKPASTEEILKTVSQVLYQRCSDRSKVMIVDDDPNMLKILRQLLENWDIEVVALQNPRQFWQVLESTDPDLLILDLIMPDYSGIDLCKAVRTDSLWNDLPIVFLSADRDRETIRQLFIAGADDYLSKPIEESDLYTRILSRLDRSCLSKRNYDQSVL